MRVHLVLLLLAVVDSDLHALLREEHDCQVALVGPDDLEGGFGAARQGVENVDFVRHEIELADEVVRGFV